VAQSFERLIPYAAQTLGLSVEALAASFRAATRSDLHGIIGLRRAVTPEMWWEDEAVLQWRYFGRPAPDGSTPYWIFQKDGAIVGACGLEPVTLSVDGSPIDAVRTLDIMVRPDLDGRGLGPLMNLLLFRKFPIVLVTGSNDASHNLISRLFQHAADLVFWKTLIASHHIIDASAGRVSKMLASAADAVLSIVRSRHNVSPPAGVSLRELSRFDDRVTNLMLRCERPGRVQVRRTAEYLNWRFFDNPRCRYRAYGAFDNGQLDAYVVTRLNVVRPNPRREGEIVDWMVAPAAEATHRSLTPLIAFALGDLKKAGAGLVTCAEHGADVTHAAEANGFVLREAQRIPFFVRASAPDIHARLTSGSGWFLTRGDLDVE
jgi:hypothetical protein